MKLALECYRKQKLGCKGTRDTMEREENLLIGHVGAKRRQVTV